jgi:putative glycerol-1-phosphate prenyltransferase
LDDLITKIKQSISLPVVLFPGNPSQISDKADAILFLSLISGRNPDYLIEHQVKAAPLLRLNLKLFLLVICYYKWSYSRGAGESNLPLEKIMIMHSLQRQAEMLGNKLIYLGG